MDYRIFSKSSGEDENSIEAHVLARAYRAVWRSTHGAEPVGQHPIAGLELVIDFGGQREQSVGNSYLQFASSAHPGSDSSAHPGADSSAHPGTDSSAYPGTDSSAHPGATPTARSDEPASAGAHTRREGDMAADLWMRVRQFGKRMPSDELEQLISELRALEQPRNSGSRQGGQCRKRRRDD